MRSADWKSSLTNRSILTYPALCLLLLILPVFHHIPPFYLIFLPLLLISALCPKLELLSTVYTSTDSSLHVCIYCSATIPSIGHLDS